MTPHTFRDPPDKRIVREEWNTPFLRYLHNEHGIRYRYMGLPGPDLVDVKLWRDMIEEVIAFERPSRGTDERADVAQLKANLIKLGIPQVTYFGTFEQVVMLRKDHDGQEYSQDRVVTLYNLDFCDEISSQIETLEYGKRRWRFDALRVIVEDQMECYRRDRHPSHFIMLLTVRNQAEAKRISELLSITPLPETNAYRSICEQTAPIPASGPLMGTHAWALKALMYNNLRRYFTTPNISALFFPFVKYIGTPIGFRTKKKVQSPMLHWMLLCKFGTLDVPASSFYPSNFLDQATSLAVTGSGIAIAPEPGEVGDPNQVVSSVGWFHPFERVFFANGAIIP